MPTPDQPDKSTAQEDEDHLYELASDPDIDAPPLPPAYQPPPRPAQPASPPPSVKPQEPLGQSTPSSSSLLDSEEPAYVSETAKAKRREEQRIAAMAEATEDKWWQQKWVLVIVGLLILLGIIYWAMYQFSNAVEEGLHNTLRYEQPSAIALSDPNLPAA